MLTFWQDLRYAARMLVKNPGFTAVAVLTLALGIGANTAIFTVVYGVLLRPLPYPRPDRIVQITASYRGQIDYSGFSALEFDFWNRHSGPFQFLAARTGVGFNLTGGSESARVRAHRVSSTYFNVLGVQPFLGRNFSADEDSPSGPNVAVLSYGLWKSQFGGDSQIVGKTISLDGAAYTVIGVMPSGFQSVPAADLWTTIAQVNKSIGSGINYTLIARLKNDTSRTQADSYLGVVKDSFFEGFRRGTPSAYRQAIAFRAMPFGYMIAYGYRTPLLVLFGAIGFVLLIACANVANLLVSRSAARTREFAVRAALGAGRSRLLGQLLKESLVLAILGGALGLVLAAWLLNFLLALAPTDLPRAHEISLDRWALGFTVLAAFLSAMLFGSAPAFHASKPNLNESLKEGEGRASSGLGRQRLRGALVVAEVALSLVLLAGASLLIKTFANLLRTDPGFDPHGVLSVQIWPTGEKFSSTETMVNFNRNILQRIKSIPGVQSVAVVAAGLPLEQGGNVGVEFPIQKRDESIDYRQITPSYFQTLGIPLRQGRFFTEADSSDSNSVVIVNENLARQYFAYHSPLGEHVKVADQDREIVGLVGNVRSFLNEPAPPTVFIPDAQSPIGLAKLFMGWFPNCILVRTVQSPLSVSNEVAAAVRGVNSDVPVGRIQSVEETLSTSVAFQKFLMTLMSVFAGLAVLLASIGIYGVMAYSVAQRTHEFGIRLALGAGRKDVLRMVLLGGGKLAALGIALGLAGALGLNYLLRSQLYGVSPADPATYLAVGIFLGLVALAACYIPARRATRLDPLKALRYE